MKGIRIEDRRLLARAATLTQAFHRYQLTFRQWAGGAKACFERREWKQQRLALRERTHCLEALITHAAFQLQTDWAEQDQPEAWLRALGEAFLHPIPEADRLAARCFWQALLPRRDSTGWYEPEITTAAVMLPLRCYQGKVLAPLVQALLTEIALEVPFQDLAGDAQWISQQIRERIDSAETVTITIFPSLFYRNQHAYLLGCIGWATQSCPLAIALIYPAEGIRADAVLLSEAAVKVLFAFSRSYFLVETDNPVGLVGFLHSILPSKPVEQLFINIGLAQYGKALLHQRLLQHLVRQEEKFTYPPGVPGKVMIVFTLPAFPVVIKVIRDYFQPPKTVSRRDVTERYQFIAHHDRVGRLADAQRFESLELPESAFEVALLNELTREAAQSVHLQAGKVILSPAYLERKMIPLDVFLQEATPGEAIEVILDYGQAIREIAMSNVFPGDLLLKNFGVTPERNVVFYDYDEIQPLTACDFRSIPSPRHEEDLLDAEPWFSVRENDIFPEELSKFLLPAGPLKEVLCQEHGDLFTPRFWNGWKRFFLAGGMTDLAPYPGGRTAPYNKGVSKAGQQ